MRKLFAFAILVPLLLSCESHTIIKNQTRTGGYALGENVKLAFSVSGMDTAPDSLAVMISEKKTGYVYETFAFPVASKDNSRYECIWNGRKPDGSWPAGGRYRVYAAISESNAVSDTVEIGLTD